MLLESTSWNSSFLSFEEMEKCLAGFSHRIVKVMHVKKYILPPELLKIILFLFE